MQTQISLQHHTICLNSPRQIKSSQVGASSPCQGSAQKARAQRCYVAMNVGLAVQQREIMCAYMCVCVCVCKYVPVHAPRGASSRLS